MGTDRRLRYKWGILLRQARADLGLSQKEFAQTLGVAQEMVSRWENGLYAPRDETRPLIAAALGKTTAELFPYPDRPPEDDANGDTEAA